MVDVGPAGIEVLELRTASSCETALCQVVSTHFIPKPRSESLRKRLAHVLPAVHSNQAAAAHQQRVRRRALPRPAAFAPRQPLLTELSEKLLEKLSWPLCQNLPGAKGLKYLEPLFRASRESRD